MNYSGSGTVGMVSTWKSLLQQRLQEAGRAAYAIPGPEENRSKIHLTNMLKAGKS